MGSVDLMMILYILSVVVNVGCAIWVTVRMAQQYSMLWALLAFFCCTLATFVWGWAYWRGPEKVPVMTVWTILVLISVALNVSLQL